MNKTTKNTWWNHSGGYIQGKVLENGKKKIVLFHRYKMEKELGRELNSVEDVHHKDGNKSNNSIENLEVLSHGKHSSITGFTRNIHKTKKSSSKYYGVYKLKTGYWSARIKRHKKLLWASMFNTELKAAKAFDKKSIELGLKPLNFNQEGK